MITHVVTFKLADPEAHSDELKTMIEALPEAIPEIRSMVVGLNKVPSDRAHDMVLISTYADIDGLRAYQEHPAHQPVLAFVRAHCTAVNAVDFES